MADVSRCEACGKMGRHERRWGKGDVPNGPPTCRACDPSLYPDPPREGLRSDLTVDPAPGRPIELLLAGVSCVVAKIVVSPDGEVVIVAKGPPSIWEEVATMQVNDGQWQPIVSRAERVERETRLMARAVRVQTSYNREVSAEAARLLANELELGELGCEIPEDEDGA